MAYHVEIEHAASRSLIRIARSDRRSAQRITDAIKALAQDPRPAGAIKMSGVEAYRVRVGDFRIIYTILDTVLVVTVVKIGNLRDVYEDR